VAGRGCVGGGVWGGGGGGGVSCMLPLANRLSSEIRACGSHCGTGPNTSERYGSRSSRLLPAMPRRRPVRMEMIDAQHRRCSGGARQRTGAAFFFFFFFFFSCRR